MRKTFCRTKTAPIFRTCNSQRRSRQPTTPLPTWPVWEVPFRKRLICSHSNSNNDHSRNKMYSKVTVVFRQRAPGEPLFKRDRRRLKTRLVAGIRTVIWHRIYLLYINHSSAYMQTNVSAYKMAQTLILYAVWLLIYRHFNLCPVIFRTKTVLIYSVRKKLCSPF